jgi:drug/metabolite transporter (DMT)-like permease
LSDIICSQDALFFTLIDGISFSFKPPSVYVAGMTTWRHFSWFLALGLFWGCSPSVYKHLANIGMPETHTVVTTGFGVGLMMFLVALVLKGRGVFNRRLAVYGAVCGLLMNIPFGLNLFLAAHVPPTELAIIITLSPLFSYLMAWATGTEDTSARKFLAIGFGFLSTAVLIWTRGEHGSANWWLMAALGIPVLYAVYNFYGARGWPEGSNVIAAGAMESLFSGLMVVPLLLLIDFPGGAGQPMLWQYWVLGALCLMWVVERIAYFTLINEKGAVYTVQATYVSTPAAVVIAAVFFGGAADLWLWVSLGLLMVALWFNNSQASKPQFA